MNTFISPMLDDVSKRFRSPIISARARCYIMLYSVSGLPFSLSLPLPLLPVTRSLTLSFIKYRGDRVLLGFKVFLLFDFACSIVFYCILNLERFYFSCPPPAHADPIRLHAKKSARLNCTLKNKMKREGMQSRADAIMSGRLF